MIDRHIASLLTLSLLAISGAPAAQTTAPTLSGTWTGTFVTRVDSGAPNDERIHMVLKQTGPDLTGTAGPAPDQQMTIAKGKVQTTAEGTTVTFEVDAGAAPIHFDLKLVDGHLKGNARAEGDGRTFAAVVDAERAKSRAQPRVTASVVRH